MKGAPLQDEVRAGRLELDEKVRAEDLLYGSLFHTEDRKYFWWGLAAAVVLHVLVLIAPLPEFKAEPPPKVAQETPRVVRYVPPPPKIERKPIQPRQLTRKVPIPDPTPDEPEPIREPEPEIEPEVLPPDAEFLIGEPEPPPQTGPLIPGVGGVSHPKKLVEVKPEYPELARKARIEGRLTVTAIIGKDGVPRDIQVLTCNRPGLGFEEAAIAAIQQWRYEPAMQNEKPVEVIVTIDVEFTLQ